MPHPERILLAVLGTTPAVLTETWCQLATRPAPEQFIPDRIIVITTVTGRNDLLRELVDTPRIRHLCKTWGIPDVFSPADVLVPRDARGEPLHDVRNADDFNAFADCVLAQVRDLTDDNRPRPCVIHASVAGGRKTMGYYLGQAMNIFGRPGDRISHILVHSAYENRGFFYPGQEGTEATLAAADGHPILEMTEFPVIPLGKVVNIERFKRRNMRFHEILEAIAQEQSGVLQPVELSFARGKGGIHAGKDFARMPSASTCTYAWLAWRASTGAGDVRLVRDSIGDGACTHDYLRQLRRYYAELHAVRAWFERLPGEGISDALDALSRKAGSEEWDGAVSDMEGHIRPHLTRCAKAVSANLATLYHINDRRPKGVYGLPPGLLPKEEVDALSAFVPHALREIGVKP